MQRRRQGHEESWLLSYADLITNLLLFFVVLLTAANISKGRMQQIVKSISGAESPTSLESIRKEIDAKIAEKHMQELVRTNVTADGLELSLNSGLVFDSGKAALRPGSNRMMVGALEMINAHPDKRILVAGYTDSTGSPDTNLALSQARAATVRNWLIDASGIPATQFAIQGYGDTRPVAGNDTREGRAKNRRVEITLKTGS